MGPYTCSWNRWARWAQLKAFWKHGASSSYASPASSRDSAILNQVLASWSRERKARLVAAWPTQLASPKLVPLHWSHETGRRALFLSWLQRAARDSPWKEQPAFPGEASAHTHRWRMVGSRQSHRNTPGDKGMSPPGRCPCVASAPLHNGALPCGDPSCLPVWWPGIHG